MRQFINILNQKWQFDLEGQGRGQRSFGHKMCVDIIYHFASLTFDLDKQLQGQICNFLIKMEI